MNNLSLGLHLGGRKKKKQAQLGAGQWDDTKQWDDTDTWNDTEGPQEA